MNRFRSILHLPATVRWARWSATLVLGIAAMGTAWASEYAKIQQLVRDGNARSALARVEQGIATNPRDPQLMFLKGVVQQELGMRVEAEQTFLSLTRQYPELPEPYNNLAAIYAQLDQFDKARDALEMAVRLNPNYAVAHENLGDVYARLAAEAYAKASQLNAADAQPPRKLALIRELFAPRNDAN